MDNKHYYIYVTIIATLAIFFLQFSYIRNLYLNYNEGIIAQTKKAEKIAIDDELHIRRVLRGGNNPQRSHHSVFKPVSEMSKVEIDSLKRRPNGKDTINIDAARATGIGDNVDDLMTQLFQDLYYEKNMPINIQVLDSIFNHNLVESIPHSFTLYNKDTIEIGCADLLGKKRANYIYPLQPIGLKQLQYLQLQIRIEMSTFIKHQMWTLSLSACILFITLICLLYQFYIIRKSFRILANKEKTINGIIHDLKTPLSSVYMALSYINETEKNSEYKDLISTCELNIKKLSGQIESILITSKKGFKELELKKENVDLHRMLLDIKKDMDILYQYKPHSIILKNDDIFLIHMDPVFMGNVFRNLLDNALKYSEDNVVVEIEYSKSIDNICISVKDNGWGISKANQKKMFTQFFRVADKKTGIKGYGLGLMQAKQIILKHGGNIIVKSDEGKGCEFIIYLPVRSL